MKLRKPTREEIEDLPTWALTIGMLVVAVLFGAGIILLFGVQGLMYAFAVMMLLAAMYLILYMVISLFRGEL